MLTKDPEITIVAKRLAPNQAAGMNLRYESTKGREPVYGFGPGRPFSDWPSTTTRNLRTPG